MKNFFLVLLILFFVSCFNRTISEDLSEIQQLTEETISTPSLTETSTIIYFENGTCKCPEATPGDTVEIDEVTYTAVDNTTIVQEIENENVNLCTSLVTNMSNLFLSNYNFNGDISFWDTSGVTNMNGIFR